MDPLTTRSPKTVEPLTVAKTGALRLAQLTKRSGRFLYRFKPDAPEESSGYNLLRHCGTIWAMMEVSNRLEPMPEVIEAATRAMDRLITGNILPYRSGPACCVVGKDNVKLGGGGLAILALTELAKGRHQDRYIELARGLGEYILLQRKDDGDFIHKRNYWTDQPKSFVSEYYTGEALFGLLRLQQATGERRWFEEAKASELQLAGRDYGVAPQSHWMLYALEQFHEADPQPVYRDHARRIVDDIIRMPAYRDTFRSTPIACRSEGLLAYVRLLRQLPASAAIETEIEKCMAVIRENLRLQLAYRLSDGGFIRGGGSTEVRIDYIQHNISSFLGYGLMAGSQQLIRS